MEEYQSGDRADALVINGKVVNKVSNPSRHKQLIRCSCYQNYTSFALGGKQCRFGCKIDGEQYPLGECPCCKCSCSFVFDDIDHDETARHFEMQRLRSVTNDDQRAAANKYLDKAAEIGRIQRDQFATSLNDAKENGDVELATDEVAALATKAGRNSQAHYIVHNPPPQNAQSFFRTVVAQADNQRGPAYSNVTNTNMRNHGGGGPQAATARARNTRLEGAESQNRTGAGGVTTVHSSSNHMMQSLQQQQQLNTPMQHSAGVSGSHMNEALNPHFNASNHSVHSSSNHMMLSSQQQNTPVQYSAGLSGSRMNEALNPHFNASNHSLDSGMSFARNSFIQHSGPGQYKTPEDDVSTPEHLRATRDSLQDYVLELGDDDNNEEEFDAAVGATEALNKPYNPTMSNFAKNLHSKRKAGEMTSSDVAKRITKVHKSMQRKK